jgi:hypothetical protein
MAAPKGSHNARGYQEDAAREVEVALRQALASLRHGTFFRNISALADQVAGACHQSPSNLRRNRRYRAILEHHLASQTGSVALLGEDTRSVGVLRAKLLEANLRAANHLRDKKRLEAYIAKHAANAGGDHKTSDRRSDQAPSSTMPNDLKIAFECTATALQAVLTHADTYEIDAVTGGLVDLADRPGSPPVVAPHLLEAFRRWQSTRKP